MALRSLGELLTIGEAAELSGVPRRTIRYWIETGRLEAIKVNARLFMLKRKDVLKLERPKMGRPKKVRSND